jgi:hypothetical protein
VKIFPSERNSFLNLSAPVLNFSGDEGKIFTFKPAQKSAGSAIKLTPKSKKCHYSHGHHKNCDHKRYLKLRFNCSSWY